MTDQFESAEDNDGRSEPWFESIDQMQFVELEDQDDWRNYTEYLTISTLKAGLAKLREIRDEARTKIVQKLEDGADSVKERMSERKRELYMSMQKRLDAIAEYSESQQGLRLQDKVAFNLGVCLFGAFTFILGRYPNDYFYVFYSIVVPVMIGIRFYRYRKRKWHYYLLDFCYFGSGAVWTHITLMPKNEILHHVAFMYSNGILAVSTAAFNNALLFHKLDRLTCLFTHPVPLVVMWNVKHVTMNSEAGLP